jgi:RND family efflux transporter MFP subunit
MAMIGSISLSQKLLSSFLILSLLTTACGDREKKAVGSQSLPVKLQTLATATVIDSSEYVGTLEARQRVLLSASRTSGRIIQILVKEGDRVRRGQRIVEIQPSQEKEDVRARVGSLTTAQSDLGAAEAELRQREAERDAAKAQVEQAKSNLAREEANVANIKAELDLAVVNYDRSQFLVKEDVQPKQDLDDKTRDLRTKKAQLDATLKARDAARGALNASISNFQAADKRVAQARANIEAKKGAVIQAQGELGSTTEQLSYNFIESPIDGVVGDFNLNKVGDNVDVGEEITTITDNQVFFLNVNIPVEFQNRLKIGLPVEILDNDSNPGVRGQVSYIAPLAEKNAQAVRVKMAFRNEGSLRDGQYVRVRVIWQTKPGILVPVDAVTSLGGQKFVYVAEEGKTKDGQSGLISKQVPVTLGNIQGQAYQVLSGVKPGDRIAVNRILDLKDGRLIADESQAVQ